MADDLDKHQVLDFTVVVILVVLCASWALQQVAIKVANHGISPILQSGIRSVGATVLLWIWMAVRRKPILESDGTLRAVIFLYLSPFVVALGARLFVPGEHLRMVQVLGLCCAFAGIAVAFKESLSLPTYRMLIGDVMLVGAAVLWGATTVLVKASPLARIDPGKTLLYQLAVSAVVLPVASLAMNEPGVVLITPLIAGCLVYQIVWVAFITYLAWFWLVRRYPASRLASFTFLTPLFGVLAGGILLKEPITNLHRSLEVQT